MLQYLIYVILFQSMFLAVYDIFHKKDTFFSLGRFYLLITSIISFILPFIKIKTINKTIPNEYLVRLPEVFIGTKGGTAATEIITTSSNLSVWQHINWWLVAYLIGFVFTLFRFGLKNYSLYKLRKDATNATVKGFKIYYIKNSTDAFSFWNSIYLGDAIPQSSKNQIITHELVHLQQKHSIDLLWFETLKIIFWFNPLTYLYQIRISTLHEYIADANSIKMLGKKEYYQGLLNSIFNTEDIPFINQFYNHSILKKRISMLNKKKSKTMAKYKFISLVPLIVVMVVLSSFADKRDFAENFKEDNTLPATTTSTENVFETEEVPNSNKLNESIITQKTVQDTINIFKKEAVNKLLKIKLEVEQGDSFAEKAILYSEDPGSKSNGGYYKVTKDAPFEEAFLDVAFRLSEGQISDPFQTSFGYHIILLEKINGNAREIRHILITPKNEMPFALIDKVPATKACENIEENSQRKSCFATEIKKYVVRYFDVKKVTPYAQTGVNRIYVKFAIDTTGFLTSVEARASHPKLEEEAKRVIQSIPPVIPGEHQGQKVKVLYSLPIVFQVEGKKNETRTKSSITDDNILKQYIDYKKYTNPEPGYYLVTGVYKRELYLKKGMEMIQNKGLKPKSFTNPHDGYYYTYLDKFETLDEAKKMLYSDFNNKYTDDLYILKVEDKD
ncbi:peptidylprolyl isomerase [Aquimarina brevivitae]|uniref:Beta-lactamase regulating signal transducer with metallopeptidase domain n=1 Tax=Aquimarina brevivitae TaxID=323412 RepID=A0A4Q7PH66_9FLAO|nr:peptidylprolyl isomerase [Aquimarina brevivitae]RZS99735.1 beta-lactamase regulating signal transducer with metallopeptidase domain [Aquimarina brevivitae]